jgi:aspartyl-tRNA(Asn)/glutamyl-tRNA(Gln) amidotransferase subunit C
MSDEITPELFEHLVELAALELRPQESEYLRQQLNNQLKAIHELELIPLDSSTPVASHGVPYTAATSPVIRPDQWHAFPEPGKLLDQAPETDDGYIIVPEIPHQAME